MTCASLKCQIKYSAFALERLVWSHFQVQSTAVAHLSGVEQSVKTDLTDIQVITGVTDY